MNSYNEITVKLMNLEKEALVNILVEFSGKYPDVADAIDRLSSDRETNIQRFISKVESIKASDEVYYWNEASSFAEELVSLLSDLEAGARTPKEGLELLKVFFDSQDWIWDKCDDSSGNIGDIYRYEATELFVKFAIQCREKDWLSNFLWELISDNGYGLRDGLLDKVGEFLPEINMREIVERLWKIHGNNPGSKKNTSKGLEFVEAMAKGLKDPFLLEKVIREEGRGDEDHNNGRLGEMWFMCGDYHKAVQYLEKIKNSAGGFWKKDELLFQAYGKVGDYNKRKGLAWAIFRRHRSKESFETVLGIEGRDNKEKLLVDEISLVYKDTKLEDENVNFMLEMNLIGEAENYILERKSGLDGDYYGNLTAWAEVFDQNKRLLVSTLIYRALLNSILERGYSKAYHYGVNYLKKLDDQSQNIGNWMGNVTHQSYFTGLMSAHKRKHGFWSQYKGIR